MVDSASETAVERSVGGWNWEAMTRVSYRAQGNELHLRIPRSVLKLENKTVRLQFKWSDHMQEEGDPVDFYVNGDTAPEGRLRFIYEESTWKRLQVYQ
jgi:hypothetical protein